MTIVAPRPREIAQAMQLLRSIMDRRALFHGFVTLSMVVAGGAVVALTPLALKSLVDAVAAPRSTAFGGLPLMTSCALAYLLLLAAGRVLSDLRPLFSGTINQRLVSRLTQRFFDHVMALPIGYLLKRRRGELLHSLDLGVAGAQLVVTHLLGTLLPVTVEIVTMASVLVHLEEPSLVIIFGVAALAYVVISSIGARLVKTATRDVSTSSLESHAQLTEGISHVETLRYFAAEGHASQQLKLASGALEQAWRRLNRLNVATALAASFTFVLSMAACLSVGAMAVSQGQISLGGFVLTTVYTLQMVRPLESLGTAARELSRAMGYLRPLLDLLSETRVEEPSGTAAATSIARRSPSRALALRLENLHFGYDADKPVLCGIDLEVPAGSKIGIVGRSGSGKSSLARLLLRLYVPQKGRILLDGRNLDSIDSTELRTLVGLVPQETALLHATIAENIALGIPAADQDDIRAAARSAQLEAFVDSLPLGLDTPVGDRGMQLSGGERQRVGIARALLRRPGLYVLDEPTSMLDSQTELEIQQALRSLPSDATTLIIAHRLSTVVDADQIVVLDGGQLRERGSHHQLLARNGLYARMWRQQMAINS